MALSTASQFLCPTIRKRQTITDHQPNAVRFQLLPLIQRCTSLSQLKQLHACVIRADLFRDDVVAGSLVSLAGILGVGDLQYASLLFYQIDRPSLFAWNSMIRAFSRSNARSAEALSFLVRMQNQGVAPNKHSFAFSLMACVKELALEEGEQLHASVFKAGLESDRYIQNNLIRLYCSCSRIRLARQVFEKMTEQDLVSATSMADGYVKFGRLVDARSVFDSLKVRDEVLWTVMISGYAQNNQPTEALRMFREMMDQTRLMPTEATLISVLTACAQLGAIEFGRWIHWYLKKHRVNPTIKVATSLINMYSKCGMMELAGEIFDKIPIPDVFAWNAMISGWALQGDCRSAFDFFVKMGLSGIWPNDRSYVAILSACNHSGMVEEGLAMFERMKTIDGIVPQMDHYGCMVDLLGKAGRLDKAEKFIKGMHIEPDDVIWRSLLEACKSHKDIRRAEMAMSKLLEMDCCESTDYAIVANLYALIREFGEAGEIRKMAKGKGLRKMPVAG